MEKDRKFRALAIAAICVAVVGVSVAYAALATTLTITGTATVDTESSWSVVFDESTISEVTSSNGVTVTKAPALQEGNAEILEWAATFTAPGQSMQFTVNVKNEGSIDAVVTGIVKTIEGAAKTVTVDEAPYEVFTYETTVGAVAVESLDDLGDNTKLAAENGTVTVTVKVTFDAAHKLTNELLTSLNEATANFTFAMTFGQADGDEGTLGVA